MMRATVLRLRLHESAALPANHGEYLHAGLLENIGSRDAALAASLHRDSELRPFSLSPLTGPLRRVTNRRMLALPGDYYLRITALSALAEQALEHLTPGSEWKLSGAKFITQSQLRSPAEHPMALELSGSEFMSRSLEAGRRSPRRILVHFASPTAFASFGTCIHFPDPALFVTSLHRRFRKLGGIWAETLPDDKGLPQLSLGRYDIQSHRLWFPAHRAARTGFTGSVEFQVHRAAPSELVAWLHILTRFAFFSGVGVGTSWGMGQVRVTPGL